MIRTKTTCPLLLLFALCRARIGLIYNTKTNSEGNIYLWRGKFEFKLYRRAGEAREETSAKFGLILMHLMRREDRKRRGSTECLFQTNVIILQHKGTAHTFMIRIKVPSELVGTKKCPCMFTKNSRGHRVHREPGFLFSRPTVLTLSAKFF